MGFAQIAQAANDGATTSVECLPKTVSTALAVSLPVPEHIIVNLTIAFCFAVWYPGKEVMETKTTGRPTGTIDERELWLGVRQSNIMQLAALSKYYEEQKAALRLQIARIDKYLGLHQ